MYEGESALPPAVTMKSRARSSRRSRHPAIRRCRRCAATVCAAHVARGLGLAEILLEHVIAANLQLAVSAMRSSIPAIVPTSPQGMARAGR